MVTWSERSRLISRAKQLCDALPPDTPESWNLEVTRSLDTTGSSEDIRISRVIPEHVPSAALAAFVTWTNEVDDLFRAASEVFFGQALYCGKLWAECLEPQLPAGFRTNPMTDLENGTQIATFEVENAVRVYQALLDALTEKLRRA